MDKTAKLADVIGLVREGDRVAFGGGGLMRKPMAAVAALAAHGPARVNVVSFLGGPDVDILLGLDRVESLSYAYVGFDGLGLAPNFRSARRSGKVAFEEVSESVVLTGLEAAARRLPFLPSRAPLGTDLMGLASSRLKTMACPFTGQALAAVPAIEIDTAFIHVNEADAQGNAVIQGDGFADLLLAQAASRVVITAESIVPSLRESPNWPMRNTVITRLWTDHVCHVPGGGGFTSVYPLRPIDYLAVADYQAHATDRAWLDGFIARQERPTA